MHHHPAAGVARYSGRIDSGVCQGRGGVRDYVDERREYPGADPDARPCDLRCGPGQSAAGGECLVDPGDSHRVADPRAGRSDDEGQILMLELALDRRLPGFHLQTHLQIGDEIAALYGPSGSGKSLTLLAISGLIRPASGTIRINGRTVFDADAGIDLAPHLRHVGLVFQEYALFPHKTVSGNLSFGLARGTSKADAADRVSEMLHLLRLEPFAQHYPHQLSGGQRQRVALGRALIGHPEILLLDEPFSALDPAVRETLRRELLQMLADFKGTILLVTHDLQEAYLMASTIAIIDDGKVLQMGTREEVLHQPRTRRVAEHTGAKNILRGVACRDPDGAWDIVWRGQIGRASCR